MAAPTIPWNDTKRGAPRSESEIAMIAGGNHTIMNTQWGNEYIMIDSSRFGAEGTVKILAGLVREMFG